MKNNPDFRLPTSIFASPSIGKNEIIKASRSVINNTTDEIKSIMEVSAALSFSREGNPLLRNFFQLIPVILLRNNMSIQKYEKHCRSCIITESEVSDIAGQIHYIWMEEMVKRHPDIETIEENYPDFLPFDQLPKNLIRTYFEFVYIIPIILKKSGYEIIRKSEAKFINREMAEKLARVIHSRYRRLMASPDDKSQNIYNEMYLVGNESIQFTSAFDELSEDVKSSNIDNAFHIPAKLLSIGYKIQASGDPELEMSLPELSDHEIETMARIEHDRWCWERRLSGWKHAEKRDNARKLHNCLVLFDELPEEEKEKDRILVRMIPSLLKDLDLKAAPVSPETAENIPYVKKDWGCISELKTSIGLLKTSLPDPVQEKARESFFQIDSMVENIKNAFTFGKKVQNSFLPSLLDFKEFLPDSFVLYKPKDIVSGDFYFISKINNKIIIAAADCTGHSISAAILTSVCFSNLALATGVKKISDPSKILKFVLPRIEAFFGNNKIVENFRFGMDITVCSLDQDNNVLSFSGFGNPIYYFTQGELNAIKGISSLKSFSQAKKSIATTSIIMNRGDSFYLFSDGVEDQLGENNEKFKPKRFREVLTNICRLPASEQCDILNRKIESWRRASDPDRLQTDDILVIGVNI
jgi:serine phosphatase RsbU (regulator of sigma subunit)